jgi:branched-chain amino acid transport system permease protein
MILMGGSQMFLGPLLGTVLLRILNDMTVAYTQHTEMVLGFVILLFVFGFRKGLLDIVAERLSDRRQAALRRG